MSNPHFPADRACVRYGKRTVSSDREPYSGESHVRPQVFAAFLVGWSWAYLQLDSDSIVYGKAKYRLNTLVARCIFGAGCWRIVRIRGLGPAGCDRGYPGLKAPSLRKVFLWLGCRRDCRHLRPTLDLLDDDLACTAIRDAIACCDPTIDVGGITCRQHQYTLFDVECAKILGLAYRGHVEAIEYIHDPTIDVELAAQPHIVADYGSATVDVECGIGTVVPPPTIADQQVGDIQPATAAVGAEVGHRPCLLAGPDGHEADECRAGIAASYDVEADRPELRPPDIGCVGQGDIARTDGWADLDVTLYELGIDPGVASPCARDLAQ